MIKVLDSYNTENLRKCITDCIEKECGYEFILDAIEEGNYSSKYDCFYDSDDECYIINRETGEYINWYKFTHIGRDPHTTCTLERIPEFIKEFSDDIKDLKSVKERLNGN